MTENKLIKVLADTFKKAKIDRRNAFVQVITNNIPVWTAVKSTPTLALYLESSKYVTKKGYTNVSSEVIVYLYNRHRTNTVSSEDILSDLIHVVRNAVRNITDPNILSIDVTSAQRDGGTIHPYTMAELVINVNYTEDTTC